MEKALAFGIGLADVGEIDRQNILQATFLAMKRAVDNLDICPDYILVDGRDFPRFIWNDRAEPLRGRHVISGDSRSLTIAAASILAKVHRDRLMKEYGRQHIVYNWGKNKGYGTKEHIKSILQEGASPLHRRVFLRRILHNNEKDSIA
jgi:ribonuclease HII